jgi:hypothetical protein
MQLFIHVYAILINSTREQKWLVENRREQNGQATMRDSDAWRQKSRIMLAVMATARRARHERNKDHFHLPVGEEGRPWRLLPIHHINLTRDHSSAAKNGVQAHFPLEEVFSADCTFHTSPAYWLKKHMDLFSQNNKEYMDEMKTNMNNDFWHLKNCPHAHLVQHMKVAMVQYWADERGEPDIAKAWMKTYKDANLSRVLLYEDSALRGGIKAQHSVKSSTLCMHIHDSA